MGVGNGGWGLQELAGSHLELWESARQARYGIHGEIRSSRNSSSSTGRFLHRAAWAWERSDGLLCISLSCPLQCICSYFCASPKYSIVISHLESLTPVKVFLHVNSCLNCCLKVGGGKHQKFLYVGFVLLYFKGSGCTFFIFTLMYIDASHTELFNSDY